MKRLIIQSSSSIDNINIGDEVTVYNGMVGYSNYEGTLVDKGVNQNGVLVGYVDNGHKVKEIPLSSIIRSEKRYFNSLTISDVLTKDFVAKMTHKGDSIWCKRTKYSRTDRDTNMENTVGMDAHIQSLNTPKQGYRVVLTTYISKHGSVDRDVVDELHVSLNDELIDEALDILANANEVIVNFAGYQRVFSNAEG